MKRRFDTISLKLPRFLADEAKIAAYNIKKYKKETISIGGFFAFLLAAIFFSALFSPVSIKALSGQGTGDISSDANYLAKESPQFEVNAAGLLQEKNLVKDTSELDLPNGKITAKVLNIEGSPVRLQPLIQSNPNNPSNFLVSVPNNSEGLGGKYTVSVDIVSGLVTRNVKQDFTWGVLAINFDKSSYLVDEQVITGMAVLDDGGKTICDASLKLEIVQPDNTRVNLKTADNSITLSEQCANGNVSYIPDYKAIYQPKAVGKYQTYLTAETKNGVRRLSDSFEVRADPDFVICRDTSMRIVPSSSYTVKATILANKDVSGYAIEKVSSDFTISEISGEGKVQENGDSKREILWPILMKAGESYDLSYVYKGPDISPAFYLLGPLEIVEGASTAADRTTIFSEPRAWQIAFDASYACVPTNTGTGGAKNWNTAANWTSCNGGYPGSQSNVSNTYSATISETVAVTWSLSASPTYPISTLTLSSTGVSNTLNLVSYTLITSSTVTINNPSSNTLTNKIDVGTGTLDAGGLITVGGANTARVALLTTSTGTIKIKAAISLVSNANSQFTVTGAGTVYLTGALQPAAGSATVTFNSGSTIHTVGSASINMGTRPAGNVTLDASSTLTLANGLYMAGNWTNNSGTSALTGASTFVQMSGTKDLGSGSGDYATTFSALQLAASAVITAKTSFTVTGDLTFVSTAAAAQSLALNTASVTATLNTVTMNQPGGAYISALNINAGTATASGAISLAGTNTTATRISKIVTTTGTLNANGGITFAGTIAATKVIDASGGAGTINVTGAVTTSSGATTTPGTTSTWVYKGATAQTIPMGTASNTYWGACTTQCYANLTILNTNASGATLGNTASSGNISGNITVGDDSLAAVFNTAYAITVASGKTFLVNNNATFNLTGTATAPTGASSTFTFDPTSTVNYKQTTSPFTLPATPASILTYGNLGLVSAGTATQNFPAAVITIVGNLTIGNGTNVTTAVANASNAINVGGSWTTSANALFTHSNGSVVFNATATGKTINNRVSNFYDVNFNSASGGWTIQTNNMTVAHNLTVTSVSSLALEASRTLEVDGVYSIADAQTANTTWGAGSVLYLNSGTSYTVGSKTQSPEVYATLQVGANTDIRMWQSSATTYTVDGTGSLYSQDHANVDGDAYIWGDFHTNTNDYWSYATDFDGAAVGGGSGSQQYDIGSGTWQAPAGVTTVQVEVWGAGGNGYGSGNGGGGGGGAYVVKNSYSVTPGNSYSYNVASGGAGSAGYSYFVDASTVSAQSGANASSGVGAAGGSSYTGDSGGAGGDGGTGGTSYPDYWGGDGGSAYNGGTGGAGGWYYDGDGSGNDGQSGAAPGGGGGGAEDHWSSTPGYGANGRVLVSWTGGAGGRQVDVRVDPAAKVTIDSGDILSAIGTASSRTTVSRQGSSNGFEMSAVSGGTINLQYTDFDYLDGALGLDIQAGSTVTSFDNTKFDNLVGTAGTADAFITVATSVIGTGTKTITGVTFNNTGSGAEFNVNRTGSDDTGYWDFVSSAGTFDGEAYDGHDGTNEANPGMLKWPDSTTNQAPNTPTSLAQKKVTGGATLATGDWTNETQVQFTATVSDPDATDTLYLCVEKDLLGTTFAGTDGGDLCGTGVAYSGTPVTVSVTITGLSDASEYHWQAQAKDAVAAYSVFASYGGNAESARDFGTDTTGPTGLSVYDGDTIGVQKLSSSASLNSLKVNWSAANFGASGAATPNKYQYAIGTTSGGTDILTWTATNSEGSVVTATGITVNTGVMYFWTVKATDLAGNFTTVTSSGQQVLASLSFSMSTNSISFANLGTANSWTGSKDVTFTARTNSSNGYTVQSHILQLLTNIISPTDTIAGWSGSWATPTAWAGNCTSNSQCGFGYTSNDTSVQGSDRFASGTNYAAYQLTAPGNIVADNAGPTIDGARDLIDQSFIITNKVSVLASQTAGTYQTTMQVLVTANY